MYTARRDNMHEQRCFHLLRNDTRSHTTVAARTAAVCWWCGLWAGTEGLHRVTASGPSLPLRPCWSVCLPSFDRDETAHTHTKAGLPCFRLWRIAEILLFGPSTLRCLYGDRPRPTLIRRPGGAYWRKGGLVWLQGCTNQIGAPPHSWPPWCCCM